MSDQNSDERSVKGTVILSAATALMGAVLGVVSLAGESDLWPSFSRERAYTEQAAHGAETTDDTLNDYRHGVHATTRGAIPPAEVAWNSPREACSAQPRKQLAAGERRGEARTTIRAAAELRGRVAQAKSPARALKTSGGMTETSARVAEVAGKVVDESVRSGVDEGGGAAAGRRLKVVAVRVLPDIGNQMRATVSAAELPIVESARLGFGSPYKCLKGNVPPSVDKSAGPAAHVAYEMIDRREWSLYLVPLLSVLDETAATETPKAEESDAGESTVSRSACTGHEAASPESVESPSGESDTDADSTPHAANCDAETRQED